MLVIKLWDRRWHAESPVSCWFHLPELLLASELHCAIYASMCPSKKSDLLHCSGIYSAGFPPGDTGLLSIHSFCVCIAVVSITWTEDMFLTWPVFNNVHSPQRASEPGGLFGLVLGLIRGSFINCATPSIVYFVLGYTTREHCPQNQAFSDAELPDPLCFIMLKVNVHPRPTCWVVS